MVFATHEKKKERNTQLKMEKRMSRPIPNATSGGEVWFLRYWFLGD